MPEMQQWFESAERVSDEWLAHCGYQSGAVNALTLARQNGYDVVFDRQQPSRGRLKQIRQRTTIFVKPDERPERIQWAVSHELGETLAYRVFEQLGVDPRDEIRGSREQVANLLAARLLLPSADFFAAADRCDSDLLALKSRYSTASHELIALRLLDQPERRCVTIFDQGQMTKRRRTGAHAAGPLSDTEAETWRRAHDSARFEQARDEQVSTRCWPIHESHWKREIMITTASDHQPE